MILGIGSDLVDMRRIEQSLERFGERFTHRCFTETERQTCENRAQHGNRATAYAKRWAAKEACAKALGIGIDQGVFLKDIGVTNLDNGRPVIELTSGARRYLQSIIPDGHNATVHLSMSDEPPYALAYVIIEACIAG